MAYYTELEVSAEDYDARAIAKILARRVQADKISADVVADVMSAFETGKALLKVHGAYAVTLVECIHDHQPDLLFAARGCGEEMDDLWLRDYSNPGRHYEAGPFDTLASPEHSTPYVPNTPSGGAWFTRVDGGRSWVRSRYLKALAVAILAFAAAVAFSYFESMR